MMEGQQVSEDGSLRPILFSRLPRIQSEVSMPASLVSQIKPLCREIHALVTGRPSNGPNRLNYMREELAARTKLVELRQQVARREANSREDLLAAIQTAELESRGAT